MRQVKLKMMLGTGKIDIGTIIGTLPSGYYSSSYVNIPVFKGNVSPFDGVLGMFISTSGNITIRSPLADGLTANKPDASLSSQVNYFVD